MFDNTKELIQESLRLIKVEQAKITESIKTLEKNEKRYSKQIEKYKRALGEDEDIDINTIKILANLITETEGKRKPNYEELAKAKIALENLKEKYSNDELKNTYYNVKDRIHDFFKKMDTEEKRDNLINTIKECAVYEQYLLIDTGMVLFVFDSAQRYHFDNKLIEYLKDDKYFKMNFLKTNKGTDIDEYIRQGDKVLTNEAILSHREIREVGNTIVSDYDLNNEHIDLKSAVRDIFRERYIEYDISGKSNVVFFYAKE
jgi:hypothetical protein